MIIITHNLNIANLYRDNLEKPVTALSYYIKAFISSSSAGNLILLHQSPMLRCNLL